MKRFICALLTCLMVLSLTGCVSSGPKSESLSSEQEDGKVKLTFTAEFYDNSGTQWLSATGSSFDIVPNKVKEYAYSTEGYWQYTWTMSSVMSVFIDGKQIDSCGSTILFADDRLEKLDMRINDVINTHVRTNITGIDTEEPWYSMNWEDWWTIQWWCINEQSHGNTIKPRIVIIQSQEQSTDRKSTRLNSSHRT